MNVRAPVRSRSSTTLTRLPEGFVHRASDTLVYAFEDVRVGVESKSYGGVPKVLEVLLGVDVAAEQQCSAGALLVACRSLA